VLGRGASRQSTQRRQSGNGALGNRVLGSKVLGNRVLGNKVLGNGRRYSSLSQWVKITACADALRCDLRGRLTHLGKELSPHTSIH